jgi:hypothetical protein
VAIWFVSRHVGRLPFFNRLTLNAETARSTMPATAAAVSPTSQRALQLGDTGTAATDLRPGGRGLFAGRLVDVQSNCGYVEKGTAIRVTAVDRFEIEVEVAG